MSLCKRSLHSLFFLKTMLLLICLSLSPVQLMADISTPLWQLVKNEQGIKVYTRKVAHSQFKAFKGEITLNTSITTLLDFINNAEQCPKWRYKCIKMLHLSDGYLYKLSHLPWPLSNRYTVMHSQLHINAAQNIYTLSLKNIPRKQLPRAILAQLPAPGRTIQMRYSDGYWRFKLKASGDIHITYQMHGDPAGALPAALANQGVTNAAFITLLNLKKHFAP